MVNRHIRQERYGKRSIIAEQTEINIKDSTKEWKIKVLIWLSKYFGHEKAYIQMEKEGAAMMRISCSSSLCSFSQG
jgi:hypothetical protein